LQTLASISFAALVKSQDTDIIFAFISIKHSLKRDLISIASVKHDFKLKKQQLTTTKI